MQQARGVLLQAEITCSEGEEGPPAAARHPTLPNANQQVGPPPPPRLYQQINHVGLFDDPSVSHVKGADFFFFAAPPGG